MIRAFSGGPESHITHEGQVAMVKSNADVLTALDKNNVKYIRLLFTDVLGHMKGMSITTRALFVALTTAFVWWIISSTVTGRVLG